MATPIFKELPFCHVDMEMENRLVLKGKSSVNGGLSIALLLAEDGWRVDYSIDVIVLPI